MAKKDISSQLQESRVFPPTAAFKKRATLRAADLERMHARAAEDYVGFWADLATSELQWMKPFTVPLDDSQAPNYRWFTDGELNASYNCLDVHLEERGDKTAIIFEGEPGDTRKLSYRELHREVCRFANALKARGIGRGDRVVIYMPLVPEAVIAMQACARIGAVHSVVFGGFSSNAVRDRIEDAGARLVITADGGWRGGQVVELKRAVDKALAEGCPSIEGVIVLQTHRQRLRHAARSRHVVARGRGRPRRHLRGRTAQRRASTVPALHLGFHGQAEGHPARHRRLPAGRQAHHRAGPST